MFLARLTYLLLQWNPDMDYKSISNIDWATGAIYWRDGRIHEMANPDGKGFRQPQER